MATVSSAGGGTSMGNAQMGTRGLSAGDWTRLQRLRGAKTYLTSVQTNEDVIVIPNTKQIHPASTRTTLAFNGQGISRIRRPASNWSDYVASQTADFVLPSQAATGGTSIKNTSTKVCSCVSTTVTTKIGDCIKCNAIGTFPRLQL
jgi:hypothetical protein